MSAGSYLKEFDRLRKSIEFPFSTLTKKLEAFNKSLAPFNNYIDAFSKIDTSMFARSNRDFALIDKYIAKDTKNIINRYSSINFQELYNTTFNISKTFEKLNDYKSPRIDFNNFISHNKISVNWSDISQVTKIMNNYATSKSDSAFSDQFNSIKELSKSQEEVEFQTILNDFEESIISQIKKNKPSIISFEGILSILLTLFLFFYTQKTTELQNEDNQAFLESIEYKQDEIIQSQERIYNAMIDHVKKSDINETFYVVTNAVNLRLKPSTKSTKICILYPNQRVKLEKRKGKWIYITYFDFNEEITKSGWAYKKYLKMLK